MNIYVASKFENVDEVRRIQALLRSWGHSITFDWTPELAQSIELAKHGDSLDIQAQQDKAAICDFRGALMCDVLVLIPYPGLKGALVEMGIALGAGREVIIVGDLGPSDNVFRHLPQVYTVEEKKLQAFLSQKASQ